jgi:D-alanyl-D-alanine carboxypeptidase/D-alanyl-D-alanine-endopeptidase (penicillin-binding protein 4)
MKLVVLALASLTTVAHATPATRTKASKDGAHARVAFGKELHPAREVVGRREEPLTLEEQTAKEIEKLLRGPLRVGTTGLFVADAKTGEPLFAVNADDALNPASNVKMISTATALELLGPEFRYPTRVLGPTPVDGAIHGDIYLLGSHDPTLAPTDFDEIAKQLADKGIHELTGNVVVGSDPTRDGIYRAIVPIAVRGGAPGEAPIVTPPAGYDLVSVKNTAKTRKGGGGSGLTYKVTSSAGHVVLEVGGSIGSGAQTTYQLSTTERTAHAANVLRAALRSHQIAVTGDVKVEELGDFVGDAVAAGGLPVELGRHDSAPLAAIVAHVNKWSINWLADRVVMTAAALSKQTTPSMQLAVDAMYGWLERHTHVAKSDVVVDTGSGLSYKTQISPHELVAVVRSAGGFDRGPGSARDDSLAHAWLDSLSVGGNDGTLTHRFRTADVRGRLHAKTGTLSTVIALSGVLDIDPQRPLVFSIVTNGDTPLAKNYVRKAHEQVIGVLCRYLAKTAKAQLAPAATVAKPAPEAADLDDAPDDPKLDDETVGGSPRP